MWRPKRYFVNNLLDYKGGDVEIFRDTLSERCLSYMNKIYASQGTEFEDCEGGLYVGVAGISYMCYYLSQSTAFQSMKAELLVKSEQYIDHALSYIDSPNVKSEKSTQASFLLGAGGVYATAALLMDAVGKTNERDAFLARYSALADVCRPDNFLKCGSDELFVGRAGYLCGLLVLNKKFAMEVIPKDKAFILCQAMISSGKKYANQSHSQSPLMYAYYGTEYLGAAHGLSSILQILLSFPDFLSMNPESEKDIKGSVDFVLSLQNASGNFPCAMDEVANLRCEEDELIHWCHGAPGVVYLMAKAYLRWGEKKYLQSCLACGEIVWRKGLLRKGPGICHGIAGSGYVFLLLYRLTRESKHLYRAVQFANFIFTDEFKSARTPDSPNSLYEGIAGTVCFLADLLCPEMAHFPFSDVF